jgi:GxxExxY protein
MAIVTSPKPRIFWRFFSITESHGERTENHRNFFMREINEITEIIIGCAIEVHKELGPGLLESSYEACLAYELQKKGLRLDRQLGLPLIYKELKLEQGYRIDLLVEQSVIVEIKSVDTITDVHKAQVLTYLKLSDATIGLLINFNVLKLTSGIKRIASKKYQEI